jgi:hypothetical protein
MLLIQFQIQTATTDSVSSSVAHVGFANVYYKAASNDYV